ncbi:YihY/virulence factor BrkB family protein [Nereida sp. MMG025]|uniref:YihY/virulence factor BrkB family protein n=1 Tax=Nereida sp. MMG025 TaxID=2909981 RepID=UPI001F20A4A6|nr:YihY/virulence factor BrkB family protein [Nereida sp. MMG025]MCF6445866.1 YihY/virulence factor BrkB family protein [Nereida sp. MMG025]
MSKNHHAHSPHHIPPRGIWQVTKRVVRRQGSTRLGLMAAGIAFYGLLSLFPGITAAVAVAGIVFDADVLRTQSENLTALLPNSAQDIVLGQLREVLSADSTSLGFAALFAIALALYSASKVNASFIDGLNAVYEEEETRSLIATTALKVALTFGLIIGFVTAITVAIALPAFAAYFDFIGFEQVITLLRWPLLLLVAAIGLAVLYRFAPDRRAAKWRWLTPGALAACVLWVAASFGFSFYVQSFGTYNETFGTLGGVIVLLTWMWLSAFIILLGALLDAELEAQTAHDSTVGPDRPVGERGAVKADTTPQTETA